jgi:glycosyltransferase involved in cell wall biosynthesis
LIRGLVLSKYGTRAASTRQRFVQLRPYLELQGITIDIEPLLDNSYLDQIFSGGRRRLGAVASAYARRFKIVSACNDYDFVWVHCELFPYLPALAERLIERVTAPVIFDFDDAIFHQYDQHSSQVVRSLLSNKLAPLLARASVAFCGNAYLADYVKPFGCRAEVVPTTVDVDRYVPRGPSSRPDAPVVGWIGSPSTWRYCASVTPLLKELVEAGKIKVLVIGAERATYGQSPFEYRDWVEDREISDIQDMDIGIMPLPDEPWARGKCGYKLIQYMACGLPVVASPVGVNAQIVEHAKSGFLANSLLEWRDAIHALVGDQSLRQRLGMAGRASIKANYSAQVHGPRIANLITGLPFAPRSGARAI